MEMVTDFIFLGSKITVDGDYSHEIKDAFSLEEKLWPKKKVGKIKKKGKKKQNWGNRILENLIS